MTRRSSTRPQLTHLVEADPEQRENFRNQFGFVRGSGSIGELLSDTEIDAYVITINSAGFKETLPVLAATANPTFLYTRTL